MSHKTRLSLAMAVAAASDLLSFGDWWFPPLQWAIDIATALILFAILGWRWMLLPGLITEAIPGVGVFPFWVLVVASIGAYDSIQPHRAGTPPGAGMPPIPPPAATPAPEGDQGNPPRKQVSSQVL